jgi:lipoprotein-releasing system permease protein
MDWAWYLSGCCRIWNCTEILNGIADFNKQLEILVPKPEKELLQIRKPLIKQMFFPVGIYAISEDLDSKYVFADLGLY